MKIAIVGNGTSSIITSLVCLKRGHKVDFFYDENIPFLNIGETCSPHILELIEKVLGINDRTLIHNGICSSKLGVKFINWGIGNTFYHNFSPGIKSIHLDSVDFNRYIHGILKERGISYYNENVGDYIIENDKVIINDKKYDFVFFCVGWKENEEYKKPYFYTVDSAVLFSEDKIKEFAYTTHKATEDGWQFEIPFPNKNLTRCGYLYNRNFSSKENIIKKLEDKNIIRCIEWNPRYSKKLLQNKHVAYNGNRLFFFEPLQALGFFYYSMFANFVCDYLDNMSHYTYAKTNTKYQNEILTMQATLAFHYKYGSIFNSDFWVSVKNKANDFFDIIPNTDIESSLMILDSIEREKNRNLFSNEIFQYEGDDFKQIHCGMTGENIENLYKNIYRYPF